ncbi:interferon-induced very large GTPase 1-like protein [Labeo rohita]|uniref:Interferon-induced very large GTPase 1-like protein n=1 Tax=Labeo rohita TaxID=84645 RepID=A0A498LVE7_LABRO|nr:interferon-induced very large GTPase 1-like protein [Labeo rohita]
MMDPNPDDILPGEDKENSTVDFNQTQLNLNNLEVSPESKQNEFAEGPVLDDKETCGEVKKEVSEETFDMEQTSVPVTSQEQTPKTEITTDHSIQANMSGRENQAHKSLEEKNNSKAIGHADMSKSPEPSDSSLNHMDPSLSVLLFGSFSAVQFGHENIVLGENIENVATSRIVSSQRKISDRHVSVINMIDFHETELYLESVDHLIGQLMDDNQIHAFIFVLRLNQLTDADKMGLEWLQRVFGDKVLQFVLILFTYETDEECDTIIDDLKKNSDLEQLLEKCGGRYQTCNKMMNNQSEMRELMNKIELLFNDNQQQCYTGERRGTEELQKIECESAEAQIIRRNTESSTSTETEEQHLDNEQTLEEASNFRPDGQADLRETPEVCDSDSSVSYMDNMFPSMTIVLFGNSSSVQFGQENILLGEKQTNMENSEISSITPVQRKISERHISVIDMTDLHETEHVDHLVGQLLNEAEIHTFIFLVQLGQITNDDILEWLQRVFGDKVLQFVLILFTYEREEECDSITNDLTKNPVLEQLLEKCGGRYQTCNKMMNSQSEMKELMDKIRHLFNKNQQQCYTEQRPETEEPQKSECAEAQIIRGSTDSTTSAKTEEQHMDNEQTLEEASNSRPNGQADLRRTPEVCDPNSLVSYMDNMFPSMTIVLFGNSSSVQFGHENILLGEKQTNMENSEISSIIPVQRKISERHISVINMTDLHETEHVDHLIGQLLNEAEIHTFIFIVQLGQLTNDDKMGFEWLQRVFGDKVLHFVLILFTYEREEEKCDSISLIKDPVLEQLLGKCGGRYHICNKMMNSQSEMRELMSKIELLFNENQQQCYTEQRPETEEPQKSECEHGPTKNKQTGETTTSETHKNPLVSRVARLMVFAALHFVPGRDRSP